MKEQVNRRLDRRAFVRWGGLAGIVALSAACAPATPSPTAAPPKPTVAPTPAPGKPTAAPPTKPEAKAEAKPTAAAKPATQPPPKLASTIKWRIAEPSKLVESAWRQMALEKGFWKDLGLDVEVQHVASGTTILQGVVAGEFDVGILGTSPVYPGVAEGAPIKLVASFMSGMFYDFYARPEIKRFEDLKGKTLGGGAPGALLHELNRATFFEKNLDFDSVSYVNIGGSPDVFKAIVAGKIDGGVSGTEWRKEAEANNVVSLGFLQEILPRYLRLGQIASDKTIKERSKELTAYLYGQTQGHRWAATHKEDTLKLAGKITGVDWSNQGWVFDLYQEKKVMNPDGVIEPSRIEYMQDLMVKLGTMRQKVAGDRILDDSIQRKVVEMLGKV